MNIEKTYIAFAVGLLVGGGLMLAYTHENRYENESRFSDKAGHMMMDGPNGMHDMGAMHVTNEKDFILGMIPHHEEAIKTATEVLERGGTTPEVRTLAQNIVAAQTSEVTSMKEWYLTWYGEAYAANENYVPMMRPLEDLSGEALDQVFLSDMIMHHMGAIMMAKSVAPYAEHAELKTLTQNIIATQSDEIDLMRTLLKDLE